jgi:acetyl/propionyl-CoA carboxylase alpha subunit
MTTVPRTGHAHPLPGIAAGESLSFTQSQISITGHAIEARIYAEDPDQGFIPSPGTIAGWSAPSGAGIRLDSGVEVGQTVTAHYDPMLAKLIASGRDREEALARMAKALEEFWIAGIRTGLPFLRRLVENPVFRKGRYDTDFIGGEMSGVLAPLDADSRDLVLALVGYWAARLETGTGKRFRVTLPKEQAVIVEVVSSSNPVRVRVGEHDVEFELSDSASPITKILHGDAQSRMTIVARKKGRLRRRAARSRLAGEV